MVDKELVDDKDFISYLDDDNSIKNQHVIIVKKTNSAVEFKFNSDDKKTISLPWHRVLKIKERGDKE